MNLNSTVNLKLLERDLCRAANAIVSNPDAATAELRKAIDDTWNSLPDKLQKRAQGSFRSHGDSHADRLSDMLLLARVADHRDIDLPKSDAEKIRHLATQVIAQLTGISRIDSSDFQLPDSRRFLTMDIHDIADVQLDWACPDGKIDPVRFRALNDRGVQSRIILECAPSSEINVVIDLLRHEVLNSGTNFEEIPRQNTRALKDAVRSHKDTEWSIEMINALDAVIRDNNEKLIFRKIIAAIRGLTIDRNGDIYAEREENTSVV